MSFFNEKWKKSSVFTKVSAFVMAADALLLLTCSIIFFALGRTGYEDIDLPAKAYGIAFLIAFLYNALLSLGLFKVNRAARIGTIYGGLCIVFVFTLYVILLVVSLIKFPLLKTLLTLYSGYLKAVLPMVISFVPTGAKVLYVFLLTLFFGPEVLNVAAMLILFFRGGDFKSNGTPKSKRVAYLLWFFLGGASAHKFYLEKDGAGIFYFLTLQILSIGWWIDLFTLGKQVDAYNAKIKERPPVPVIENQGDQIDSGTEEIIPSDDAAHAETVTKSVKKVPWRRILTIGIPAAAAIVLVAVGSFFIGRGSGAQTGTNNSAALTSPVTVYQATANLRLRETPSTSANVVTTITQNSEVALLEKGESVTIDGRSAPWFKVKTLDGAIGWCFSAYLTEITVSGGNNPVAGTHWEGTLEGYPLSVDFGNGTFKWTFEGYEFEGYETIESTYKVQTAMIFTVEDGLVPLIMEGDSLILPDPDSRDIKFTRKSGKALKGSKWEGDLDGKLYTLEFTGSKVKMAGDGKKYESTYITCSVIGFDNFADSDETLYLKLEGDKLSDIYSYGITLTKSKASSSSKSVARSKSDWDKLLKDYEKFVNDFSSVVKKAAKKDVSAIAKLPSLMQQVLELAEQFENVDAGLTPAQAEKLLKVQVKFAEASLEAAKVLEAGTQDALEAASGAAKMLEGLGL